MFNQFRNALGLGTIFVISMIFSTGHAVASSSSSIPTRGDVCDTDTKTKITTYLEAQATSCETTYSITTDNHYEESRYYSENEDANCDLGFEWPSLPGISIDFSLDACQILQDVTEDVVNEVNETMQESVDSATEAVTGDEDGLDVSVGTDDVEEAAGISK